MDQSGTRTNTHTQISIKENVKNYVMVNKNILLGTHFYLQTLPDTETKCLRKDRASNFDGFNT